MPTGVEVATAYVSIVPETRGLARSLTANMGGIGKTAGSSFSGGFASTLAKGAAVAGIGAGLIAAFKGAQKGMDFNAVLEQNKIGFESMLGSADKAKSLLGDLQKFAAKTPFEFPELAKSAKTMLAMGFSSKELLPTLTAVGDAASGLGLGAEGVDRITRALGQMRAKGKVSAEEMLQLTEAGVPAWDILAKSLGVTTAEAMKLSEKGLIPADKATQALISGMEQRFPNMMAKQSQSFSGLMSTLKDNVNMTLGQVMAPAFERIKLMLPPLIDLVGKFSAGFGQGGLLGGLQAAFPAMTGFNAQLAPFVTQAKALFAQLSSSARAFAPAVRAIGQTAGPVLAQVGAAFRQLAIEVIPTVTHIVRVVTAVWRQIAPVVVPVIQFIVRSVGANLSLLAGIISAIMRAIRGDWSGAWAIFRATAMSFAKSTRDNVEGLVRGLIPGLATIGRNIVASFAASIRNGGKAVADAGKALANKLIQAVKNFLGIHSPSRVFQGIGGHVVSGLVRGLNFGNAMGIVKKFFGGVWGMVGKVPSLAGGIFDSGDPGLIMQMMQNVKGLVGGAGSIGRGLAQAWAMVGKPYVWGAMSQAAADCSGLVSLVLQAMGLNYGRLTTATIPGALAPGRGKAVTVGLKPGHTGISVAGQWFEAKGRKWGILGPGQARSSWSSYWHPPGFSTGGVISGPSTGYPVTLHGTEGIFTREQMAHLAPAKGGDEYHFHGMRHQDRLAIRQEMDIIAAGRVASLGDPIAAW